jgi:AraC-like DNA-binding protein
MSVLYYKIVPPHPLLKRLIHSYWVLRQNASPVITPEIAIPDGFVEIIFNFSDPYRRIDLHTQMSAVVAGSVVVGGRTTPVTAERLGSLDMVGVNLLPEGLYRVLKIPMHHLTHRIVPLADLDRAGDLQRLENQLFHTPQDGMRIRLFNAFFLKCLGPEAQQQNAATWMAQTIIENNGTLSIRELCEQNGLYYKKLDRIFQERVGLSPKVFSRIVRFRHILVHLNRRRSPFYDGTFFDFGFYDQNHFIREFKYFMGVTPTKYYAQRSDFSFEALQARSGW